MNCKNCEAPLEGPFCSACGQKVITERMTVKRMFREVFSTLTNLDRGFLHTIQQLFVAPDRVFKRYIDGATREFYHPLRYFLILMGISVIIGLSTGLYEAQGENMNQMMGLNNASPEEIARQKMIAGEVKKYLNFIPLLLIPFLSFISSRLFRSFGYNYAEHLVLNTFLYGHLALIGLPTLFLYMAVPSLVPYALVFSFAISTLFYGYVIHRLFKEQYFVACIQGLIINVGGYILFLIIVFILALVGTILVILIGKALGFL
jgi:hypothetical protein